MASKKPQEMTNEELLKNENILKLIIYMMLGAALVLLVVGIVLTLKKGFNALVIIPVSLLPIAIVNLNTLKEIQKEIKARNLKSR